VTNGLDEPRINRVVAVCRKIIGVFSHSHLYRTKLSKLQKELHLPSHLLVNDVVTRWGSKYKMMERIQEQFPALTQIFLDDRKHRHLTLTWQDKMVIDSTVSALKGFYELTDLLSGEQMVTISSYRPMVSHIQFLCSHGAHNVDAENAGDEGDTLERTIKNDIQEYINDRLQDINTLMFLSIAQILDPRYSSVNPTMTATSPIKWPDCETVKEKIVLMATEDEEDDSNSSVTPERQESGADVEAVPQKKRCKSLVSTLKSGCSASGDSLQPASAQTTPETRVRKELEFYLQLSAEDDCDVLQWWRRHEEELPSLSKVACRILCSCATSVPSERLFSLSGNIVTKKRNALKPQLVNMLTFLAFNKSNAN
jgi:hypothetical protein